MFIFSDFETVNSKIQNLLLKKSILNHSLKKTERSLKAYK